MTVKCRAVCATRASPSPIKGRASMLSCSVEPKLLNNTELGTTTWSWCCLSSTVNRRFSTVEYGSVRLDTVQYGSVRFSTVGYGWVRLDTVQYGSVRLGTVEYG